MDLSVIADADLLIMTQPCRKFTSLYNGTKDKYVDKIKMGLADANVRRWSRKCGRMCTLRKFKVERGENVQGFFFGENNDAWLQLKHLAQTAGYEVFSEKINIADLEMPMSRPRWFFTFIRDDVDFDPSKFKSNFDALILHQRTSDYDINSTQILSKAQLRQFRVSEHQQSQRLLGVGALTPREQRIVQAAKQELQKKQKLALRGRQPPGCSVVDVSMTDKNGWKALHSTPNEFPCVTGSNTKKLFVIGDNWNYKAYPQELGLGLGYEATPLSAMCVAMDTDTP